MDKRESKEEIENVKAAAGKTEQAQTDQGTEAAVDGAQEEIQEESADIEMELQNQLEEAKDKYLRLYSEFENFRKRTAREKLEMVQSANEQLISALLPVLDDFERASQAVTDKANSYTEGFLLIHAKLRKVLDAHGVKDMEIDKGATFDADFHDAITQIPAPEPDLKGKIVDVIEKGYFLNDKVIRYAKVVVGN